MGNSTTTTESETTANAGYEVAVVGGGPAGLTTALYTARLGHETVVLDRGGGRGAMIRETHNVIGVPESVSGAAFLETGVEQVRSAGAAYHREFVTGIERRDSSFELSTTDGSVRADRVVLATGFSDGRPDPPLPRTGRGLHYCIHCDAPQFVDEPVYVMGHGDSAAAVALLMLNVTDDVDLLLRGEDPVWSDERDALLSAHPVTVVHEDVTGVRNGEDGWLEALTFEDGAVRPYRGGFAMYGAEYNNDLASSLGAQRTADGAVVVDDDGRTSVDGVYAVGDLTPGHNQIPVAMGQGAAAGIALHKSLRTFPLSLEELETQGAFAPEAEFGVPNGPRSRASTRSSADGA